MFYFPHYAHLCCLCIPQTTTNYIGSSFSQTQSCPCFDSIYWTRCLSSVESTFPVLVLRILRCSPQLHLTFSLQCICVIDSLGIGTSPMSYSNCTHLGSLGFRWRTSLLPDMTCCWSWSRTVDSWGVWVSVCYPCCTIPSP